MTRSVLVVLIGVLGLPITSLSGQEPVDLPADDIRLRANFDEVFRVGALDGEDWETFGSVAGLGFDGEGNLYVYDPMNVRVVVVDQGGGFVRTMGRPGQGPGEVRSPAGFAVWPDGTAIIADAGHRAFLVFSPEGSFEREVSFQEVGAFSLGRLMAERTGGTLLTGGGNSMTMVMGRRDSLPDVPETRPIERVFLDGQQERRETLAEGWRPPRAQRVTGGGRGSRGRSIGGRLAFQPELFVGSLPSGGLVYADSTRYAITVLSEDGTPIRELRRPFRPEIVTENVMEQERARRLLALEAGEGPELVALVADPERGEVRTRPRAETRSMQRVEIEGLQFNPEIPVIHNLRTGWGGVIWVERRDESTRRGGPIDLLSAEGRYIGTFPSTETGFPAAFGPDGMVAFLEPDEFGVPMVVVRRLPESIW